MLIPVGTLCRTFLGAAPSGLCVHMSLGVGCPWAVNPLTHSRACSCSQSRPSTGSSVAMVRNQANGLRGALMDP